MQFPFLTRSNDPHLNPLPGQLGPGHKRAATAVFDRFLHVSDLFLPRLSVRTLAPDLSSRVHHKLQLPALIVHGEHIALRNRRKSALGAQG